MYKHETGIHEFVHHLFEKLDVSGHLGRRTSADEW